MDKTYVKSVIEGLKSSSSSCVQESLMKIKNKIIINDNGIKLFRTCGGLDCLLPHLRKPNERILDITLSILGNCCLEEECSLLVGKLNSFGPLVTIIKTVCRDSIVGRACRLMGNLAQRPTNAEALHNHGAVAALVALIESRDKNTTYPTLTMAVRSIRLLWMVTNKREEMLSLSTVRSIAILLTTECESAGIIKSNSLSKESDGLRKSQEELIIGILKCMGYFTTYYSTSQSAEQIQGDGRGYQCLVALTKVQESLALKCLMNLCYLSQCRPMLGIAGLVECLVGILQKLDGILWWPDGCARALSQLSGESVNRARLRHCGGLPLLLAAARESHHAMHALLQYVFDETSFQILVNEGLINLLTDELSKYVTTMQYEHNHIENADTLSEKASCSKEKQQPKSDLDSPTPQSSSSVPQDAKTHLFTRRKSQLSNNTDELKVVIERDNMIVGFIDAMDSDASDDSQSEGENSKRRKCLKRSRSRSPVSMMKKSHLIKMANKAWSAGVYWEPKSPETQPYAQLCGSREAMSPDRSEQGPLSPYSDGNQSGFSPEYRGFPSKRPKFDWSPDSSGISSGEGSSASPYWTEYQWSPSSSGPTSPFSVQEESSDSEISGRYSPVCSEPGSEGAGAGAAGDAAVDIDLADLAVDDSGDDELKVEEEPNMLFSNTATSRIACVLVLLFRVSHGAVGSTTAAGEDAAAASRQNALDLLAGRECLHALLDYVQRCRRPLGRAAMILYRVLSNALCLMHILKHKLVLRLHYMSVNSKHPPTKCQQCKQIIRLSAKLLTQLTILAESSYGIGEISYQLLKGNDSIKDMLSLTLPYIVRTEKALKKYFIDCSALNLLISIISEAKEDMNDCITAISKLAINLQIKDPKTLEKRFTENIYVTYDPILDNLTADSTITFELDDSSTVTANKTFLCQNSDFFCAMLMGCFKESAETCVRLQNVTKPALEYMFTLLHFGLNNAKIDLSVFPMAEKLETNLEVLLLADRFLFNKIKELVSCAILQFQMTPETAEKIYLWSLNEGMGFLCVETVAYLLTGKMAESDRTRAFSNILDLKYREQWLDDIKSMIFRQLMK